MISSKIRRCIAVAAGAVLLGAAGVLPAVAEPLSSVSHVSVTISPPSMAGGALTTYVVQFTTSASGSLSGNAGATITVNLPPGTGLSDFNANSMVTVSGNQVGVCAIASATQVSCGIFSGDTVPASTAVTLTLDGVNNPATAKACTLSLFTTSDTTAVTSPSYTVTSATKIGALSVKPSSTLPGATNVTYAVQFTAATGLAGNSGSSVTLTFPVGTSLAGLSNGTVTVLGSQVGVCAWAGGTVASCGIFGGDTVAAGARVAVSLSGLANPGTTQARKLKVSTTSDVKTASFTYCIAASGVPCIARLVPGSGPAGAAVTVAGVNLANATAVEFHGTAAAITTDTATKLTTAVPGGATSGPVTVVTPGGTAASPSPFTVT